MNRFLIYINPCGGGGAGGGVPKTAQAPSNRRDPTGLAGSGHARKKGGWKTPCESLLCKLGISPARGRFGGGGGGAGPGWGAKSARPKLVRFAPSTGVPLCSRPGPGQRSIAHQAGPCWPLSWTVLGTSGCCDTGRYSQCRSLPPSSGGILTGVGDLMPAEYCLAAAIPGAPTTDPAASTRIVSPGARRPRHHCPADSSAPPIYHVCGRRLPPSPLLHCPASLYFMASPVISGSFFHLRH